MRRGWSVLLAALFLTGCAGTPQSREAGSTLEVSVLGAETAGKQLRLTAAAAARREDPPPRSQGVGPSPAAAMEDLAGGGEQVVSAAHVEHLLLAKNAANWLPALLDYAFRDPQQSTETQLWVADGDDLTAVFEGEEDPARRMEVLKTAGRDRQGFCPVTLRQAAGALEQGEPVLLPTVDPRTLARTGAALYDGKGFTARLDREEALGAALLLGQRVHWTASVREKAMSLQLVRCRLLPRWKGDRLTGLWVCCVLEGVRTGGAGGAEALEAQTEARIRRAVEKIQEAEAGRMLAGRAGLSEPGRWRTLQGQWDRLFSALPVAVDVTIRTDP